MNKQEIQDEIRETREKLEALESRLKEPEKWKPKGGRYSLGISPNYKSIDYGATSTFYAPTFLRTETVKMAGDLAQHLTNQAILCQLANDLNGDWVPDWGDVYQKKWYVCYAPSSNCWRIDWYICNFNSVVFSYTAAVKAIEILNSQDIGIKL